MRFSKALIAALSISMISTPILAQSAAPLSLASAAGRAGAPMAGASNIDFDEDNMILPAAVLIAIIAAVILLRDDKEPTSP
jgi:hypothetical protein